MFRLGVELTDRCNLACTHCLRAINEENRNFDPQLLLRLLPEAFSLGFREVVYTGGEPTLHPHFAAMAAGAVKAGLALTVVSNGQRPASLWAALASGARPMTVALSIESAGEAGFEAVRGVRTYRRWMKTLAGLQARGVRVLMSATIGPWNLDQVEPILQLAAELEVAGVSLATYQPTARNLSPFGDVQALREAHARLEAAAAVSAVPVTLSYEPLTAQATHLCSTLGLTDLNLNYRGEATFCCQLSSLYGAPSRASVVVADTQGGLVKAAAAQSSRVAAFLDAKIRDWRNGPPQTGDVNPCSYCRRVFGQIPHGARHAA